MKITTKIKKWEEDHPRRPFISLEFVPPKTETGFLNLYERFDRFAEIQPLWIDVTWGAGGTPARATLQLCADALKYHGLEPLMHLTCMNMTQELLTETLAKCKQHGIRNILALRGDPPANIQNDNRSELKDTEDGGNTKFNHAIDLIRYIRAQHGDYFCIAVAGYPEGHLENPDTEDDLRRLKEKIDAGGELILTQLFFDVSKFAAFLEKCRKIGINVPIIPGILPIQSYAGFKRFTTFCKTYVPPEIIERLETIKDDDQRVKDFGIDFAIEMCKSLLKLGVLGLHFYTLNLEVSVLRIVDSLNIIDFHLPNRSLPWKPRRQLSSHMENNQKKRVSAESEPETPSSSNFTIVANVRTHEKIKVATGKNTPKSFEEDVRPIFWSNRPKSYIYRTAGWDDFPNGRWGNRDSPAYGEPFYSMCTNPDDRSASLRRAQWGEVLMSETDVIKTFVNYLKFQKPTKRLPWTSETLNDETALIKKLLIKLNTLGLCTINSQPRVNGALSTDPIFGWGPEGGFVYQKAYIEFFCCPKLWHTLQTKIDIMQNKTTIPTRRPLLSYMATTRKGCLVTNIEAFGGKSHVNAVTWGTFPNSEIQQPTVVDLDSFMAWKDEAFDLWNIEWASIYPEESVSRRIIQQISSTWYLVNIVDNDVVAGDLFGILITLLTVSSEVVGD